MGDHQRVHPAGDVEAPPTTVPVPLAVPLPQIRKRRLISRSITLYNYRHARSSLPVNIHAKKAPTNLKRSTSTCSRTCWRSRCMCCTIGILVFVFIIIGATAGILYLIFQPKLPNYSVDSLKISDLRLNLDMTLYAKFDVKITANNPNKKIGIHYEQGGRLSVWYTNMKLCQGTLPKFYQGHQNKTLLNVALTGQTQYGNTLMNALQQKQQTGRIPLDLKVDAPVAIQLGRLKLRKLEEVEEGMETIWGNHEFRDERDEEIQALRRQVDQPTLRLECQEARSKRGGSSCGSSSDEGEVNPFGHHRRNCHDSFKDELPEFHGRLHPEEFLGRLWR
ncbi:NDR1/HIN1-like protein 13 [Prunus yedoensis var. nudiflora]|uniref:NDR1/HIN1-like protein 13 n=1 Tax=Prunus yedoensis var. nudiflora TaxID=2094558 RepID=A0A314ZLG6_PRUYE|nr:NDR1/HIN1-like protein 13 [Prunus yedoensis var. nudiflora]